MSIISPSKSMVILWSSDKKYENSSCFILPQVPLHLFIYNCHNCLQFFLYNFLDPFWLQEIHFQIFYNKKIEKWKKRNANKLRFSSAWSKVWDVFRSEINANSFQFEGVRGSISRRKMFTFISEHGELQNAPRFNCQLQPMCGDAWLSNVLSDFKMVQRFVERKQRERERESEFDLEAQKNVLKINRNPIQNDKHRTVLKFRFALTWTKQRSCCLWPFSIFSNHILPLLFSLVKHELISCCPYTDDVDDEHMYERTFTFCALESTASPSPLFDAFFLGRDCGEPTERHFLHF